jgi:tetratricopeptide (TPR) repeat protein
MSSALASLDQTELLQLAIHANQQQQAGQALAYLKEATSRTDATAAAHYLLGAEYAHLRLYDRAVAGFESAIAIDPSLAIARFQLGLLLMTCGEADRALDVMAPLEQVMAKDGLALFAQGLRHLAHDEFAQAAASLTEGMQLNQDNPALNADMQKIVDQIAALPPAADPQTLTDDAATHSPHISLSAYTGLSTQ